MSHINVGPKYLDNSVGSRLLEGAKKATIQRGHIARLKEQRCRFLCQEQEESKLTTGNTLSALSP